MPTPFMHLDMAEKILAYTDQHPEHQQLANLLRAHWPAFYFGSIAADYPTVTSDRRETSHFYNIPPDPNNDAYSKMLREYPMLQFSKASSLNHAVFVAAYCAHLMLDLIWFREVLVPLFFQSPAWEGRKEMMTVHFIMLTYFDKLSLGRLPQTAQATLAQTAVSDLLPFATNQALQDWQQLIVEQLAPNAPIKTIEIYAGRLGMSVEEFAQRLEDRDWMQRRLYDNVPVAEIAQRLETAVPQSVHLLEDYVNLRIPHYD